MPKGVETMKEQEFSECPFCAELNSISNSQYFKQNKLNIEGFSSRIVISTENYVVMPTVGCFREGYLLIVTKKHYYSFADVPLEMMEEIERLIERVKALLRDLYGQNVICFEHGGAVCSMSMGSCIDHAHLHILPYNGRLTEEIKPFALKSKQIEGLSNLRQYVASNTPYLLWQDADDSMFVVDSGFVPSQFLRRVIAAHYGIPNKWDWRQYPFVDNMEKTIKNIRSYLEVIHNEPK